MIAAGIFVLSGLTVSKVGAVAIGSFLLPAVVAGFTAASYAEFSSVYQESGGGYMYVAESGNHDLTILGATREGVIQKFVFGTIPETVAERAPTTVIMAKRELDVKTRLQESLDKFRERVRGSPTPMERDSPGDDAQ